MNFSKRTITVNDTDVELDVDVGLPIANVSTDMDRIASQMAWWGSVWAAAEREAAQVEAHYRQWRASKINEIVKRDPKLAEWKVKALVEADPKFLAFKRAAATTIENTTLARAVFDSLDKKSNQLQSKGAMQRSELAVTGMTTPEHPRSAAMHKHSNGTDVDHEQARTEKVRGIFRNKKRK
jgi:hypothetical protein